MKASRSGRRRSPSGRPAVEIRIGDAAFTRWDNPPMTEPLRHSVWAASTDQTPTRLEYPMLVENTLRQAWTEALGSPPEDENDDFFGTGGDSLSALSVAADVRRQLGVALEPGWLYEVPRFAEALADLRERVCRVSGGAATEITRGPITGDHPLSLQQEGLLAWEKRLGERHHHRLAYAVALPAGGVDLGRLRAAVARASHRHPALRTSVADNCQRVQTRELDLHLVTAPNSPLETARSWAYGEGGPLAALAVVHGGQEDLLVLSAHQLVMDPWSWGLLLREIAAGYEAPDRPHERGLAYSDYARWQREHLRGARYSEHLEFWRSLAAGYPAGGLALPHAPARIPVAGPADQLPVVVPAALAADLREIGRQAGASLFQALLALFHAGLAAWAGVPDVLVGSASANRTLPGTDQVVGFFVNGRFTRSQPGSHPTLIDLVAAVGGGWRAGDAHQELHLEKTVFDLGVPDLVNVKFSLDDVPTLRRLPDLGGQRLRPVRVRQAASARRHLALSLRRVEGGLAGWLTYRTDLLSVREAAGLLRHFEQVSLRAARELGGR